MTRLEVPAELRRVAEAATREFVGEDARLEPVAHSASLTFRVEASGLRYLLRLHVPRHAGGAAGRSHPAEIESECAWLLALDEDTDLVVPRPVSSPGGGHVLGVPGARGATIACTLLRWVEGEHVEPSRCTHAQVARVGELVAALQIHAASWRRPEGFARPTHDRRWTRTALGRIAALARDGVVQQEQASVLERAVDRLEAELAPLERDPNHAGLIHGDLHDENLLFQDGEPRPLDFGACGSGPWLYDLAECCMHFWPRQRQTLVDAYAATRGWRDGDLRRLEGYVIAAAIETAGYHAPDRSRHDGIARTVAGLAEHHARRYLDGQSFLYDV